MVFLVDKYEINNLSEIICHKNIYRSLFNGYNNSCYNLSEYNKFSNTVEIKQKLNKYRTNREFYKFIKHNIKTNNINPETYHLRYIKMPNLLICGNHGSGKKTLIKLLLQDIYDIKINNLKKVTYQITGYGNSISEVIVEQSEFHIIIEPTGGGIDKYLIHEIVKEYAQQTILNVYDCKSTFRIVLINNIDNL